MQRWADRVIARATTRNVLGFVLAFAAILIAMEISYAYFESLAPGVTVPDLMWGYRFDDVYAIFEAMGPDGRRWYLFNLVLDTIMPFLGMIATILVVARVAPRWLIPLSIAPVGFFVFDVIENLSFAVMVLQFPDVSRAQVTVTQPVTLVKLVMFWFFMLPTLIIGAIVLLARYAISRSRTASER